MSTKCVCDAAQLLLLNTPPFRLAASV